jgi:Zn-dependent alcohol dehydrogenase
VINMARDKRIEVSGLISKRYPFERINEALQDLEAGRNLMGITLWQ